MTEVMTEEEANFAVCFHRAFRKALDSTASVIMWNAIILMDQIKWIDFCKEIVGGNGSLEHRCINSNIINISSGASSNLFRHAFSLMSSSEFEVIEKYCL